MKRISILVLLLLVMLAFVLMGCTHQPEAADAPKLLLGFSQLGSESAWRLGNTRSIQEAAERAEVGLMMEDAKQKQENQIAALRSFIAYRVDVIAFSPIVENGWDNVLKEARDAGIPVILVDRMIETEEDDLFAAYVGADFAQEGVMAGEYLLRKADELKAEKLKIVEIAGTLNSTPMRQRQKGFLATLGNDERFEILETVDGDFLRSKGAECMDYLLEKYGSEIDVLYSHNDGMTLGAMDAIREAGLEPGKDIIIITVDGEQAAIDELKAGQINCVVECTPYLGDILMDLSKRLHEGEEIPFVTHPQERSFTEYDDLTNLPPRGY